MYTTQTDGKLRGRQARRIVSGGMMLANAVVAAVLLLPYYTVVLIELFDWDDADATPPGGGDDVLRAHGRVPRTA